MLSQKLERNLPNCGQSWWAEENKKKLNFKSIEKEILVFEEYVSLEVILPLSK